MRTNYSKLVVVGMGGIGSFLAEPLVRLIKYKYESIKDITFVDGDYFEEKNRERQCFKEIGNKARIKAEELHHISEIKVQDQYINSSNVASLCADNTIVLLCVDNHATRKLIEDSLIQCDDVCCINGGNEYTDGDVMIWSKEDEEFKGILMQDVDEAIKNPKDLNPTEIGCHNRQPYEPQLIVTNFEVASTMLEVFYNFMEENPLVNRYFLDVVRIKKRGKE